MSTKVYARFALVSITACLIQIHHCGALKAETGDYEERPRYQTVYACEGSTLNMECEAGHVINLIRANYGRFSILICNEHGNTAWSVNCMSPRSNRVLHDKCSQRQDCNVAASTHVFGDPCPGTLKYLEAHFQCDPVDLPSYTSRMRPPWFVTNNTTVSSNMQDDQPLQHQRDSHAHQLDNVDDAGEGSESTGGRISLEERLDGAQSHGAQSPMLSDFGDQNLAETIKSPTTTLRPPPWLFTRTTKNTTTTTTMERATTTTSTTSTTAETPTTTLTTTERPPLIDMDSPVVNGMETDKGKKNSKIKQPHQEEISGATKKQVDSINKEVLQAISTTTLRNKSDDETEGSPIEASWYPPSSDQDLLSNRTLGCDTVVQPCPGCASGFARHPCDYLGWASLVILVSVTVCSCHL